MIFVTVGTHEQQFNRLVKCVDELKQKSIVSEEVIIQTGFSTYEPKYCKWRKLFSSTEMKQYVQEARIVITHGGPSSFMSPLQIGKTPIVVPRMKDYGEHVNNHQVDFCRAVAEQMKTIILVEQIEELETVIRNYENIISGMKTGLNSNNQKFNKSIQKIVEEMFLFK